MKDTLKPGLVTELTYAVEPDMTPRHLAAKVLSTPSMISMIERTCTLGAQSHMSPGQTTVGTHVNVSHDGPAFVGETVKVKSRLREINKNRLLFETEVESPRGTISVGTHERAIIDVARFGSGKE